MTKSVSENQSQFKHHSQEARLQRIKQPHSFPEAGSISMELIIRSKDDPNVLLTVVKEYPDIARSVPDKNDGWTILHCAAYIGNRQAIELLIKSGADLEQKTHKGLTAIDIAEANMDDSGLVKFMKEERAKYEEREKAERHAKTQQVHTETQISVAKKIIDCKGLGGDSSSQYAEAIVAVLRKSSVPIVNKNLFTQAQLVLGKTKTNGTDKKIQPNQECATIFIPNEDKRKDLDRERRNSIQMPEFN